MARARSIAFAITPPKRLALGEIALERPLTVVVSVIRQLLSAIIQVRRVLALANPLVANRSGRLVVLIGISSLTALKVGRGPL